MAKGYQIVTVYTLYRHGPLARAVRKDYRALCCRLGQSDRLNEHVCGNMRLEANKNGLHTTADRKFSVEFVECLASCGTAPVMMVNEDFHEGVSTVKADEILGKCN